MIPRRDIQARLAETRELILDLERDRDAALTLVRAMGQNLHLLYGRLATLEAFVAIAEEGGDRPCDPPPESPDPDATAPEIEPEFDDDEPDDEDKEIILRPHG